MIYIEEFNRHIFCNNLKKYRKNKGFSGKQMAIESNLESSYYNKIENGKIEPSYRHLIIFSNIFKIRITDLLIDNISHCSENNSNLNELINIIENYMGDEKKLSQILNLIKVIQNEVNLDAE